VNADWRDGLVPATRFAPSGDGFVWFGCSGFDGGALRVGALTTVGPSATLRSVVGGALWDLERDVGWGLSGLGCSGYDGNALGAGALTTVGPSATSRSVCGGALSILERDVCYGLSGLGCYGFSGGALGWERSRR